MTRVLLIRHGETQWNTTLRFQGKTDTELSEKGIEQAKDLAERLKNMEIDIIYSSPLKRAYETAKAIAGGKEVIADNSLIEIDFGRWEGLTLDEIKSTYADEYKRCFIDPYTHGFRDGLTYAQVEDGAKDAIERLIIPNKDKTIAIVSHNVILKMLLLSIFKLPPHFYRSIYLDNCSVSVVEYTAERTVLRKLNNTDGEIL